MQLDACFVKLIAKMSSIPNTKGSCTEC